MAGNALHIIVKTGYCIYFVILILVDFPVDPWNAVGVTLAIFLYHLELIHLQRKPGRAKHSTNKKEGKGVKQPMTGLVSDE